MKVLCIGHATYDVVIPVSNYPIENTKNRVDACLYCGGGPASNAAYLLGKWGVDTYFCGVVGHDYEGAYIEQELKNVGVKLDYLIKNNNYKTTKSYIIVNKSNASRTSLASQSNVESVYDVKIKINPSIILIDGHEKELAKKIINDNPNSIVVLDAGRYNKDVVELCNLSDYIICSKEFASLYSNSTDISVMFDKLNNDYSGEVIITLEEEGCVFYSNGLKRIKSIPTNAKDTTGAGDIFHGAFVYGLVNRWDLYKNLTFATTTAGLSVTRFTGRKSIFPLVIVEDVYNELRRRNFYW